MELFNGRKDDHQPDDQHRWPTGYTAKRGRAPSIDDAQDAIPSDGNNPEISPKKTIFKVDFMLSFVFTERDGISQMDYGEPMHRCVNVPRLNVSMSSNQVTNQYCVSSHISSTSFMRNSLKVRVIGLNHHSK